MRPTVLIDMDGVIADFDTEVLARISKRYPDILLLEDRENFYISEDYPAHRDKFIKLFNEPGLFESLPVMDGAVEGLEQVLDLGFHAQICTKPLKTNPTCEREKLNWLDKTFTKKFGSWVVEEAIMTEHKHLCNGIALLDDNPQIPDIHLASWSQVVFDKQYNRGLEGPRLFGWHDSELPIILNAAKEAYFNRAVLKPVVLS